MSIVYLDYLCCVPSMWLAHVDRIASLISSKLTIDVPVASCCALVPVGADRLFLLWFPPSLQAKLLEHLTNTDSIVKVAVSEANRTNHE